MSHAFYAEPPTDEQPVAWFADGEPVTLDLASRFRLLARAVREHERASAHRAVPKRPRDHRLYRMLTELEDPS
jgi:hypothetical protein